MLVQVKTDNHIEGNEKLQNWVNDQVTAGAMLPPKSGCWIKAPLDLLGSASVKVRLGR